MDINRTIEYKYSHNREVLAHDKRKDYEFYVIYIGTHPCAYVLLPEGHPLSNAKDYEDIAKYIHPHGGVNYYEKCLKLENSVDFLRHKPGIIGWDYGHIGDYVAHSPSKEDKRWTIVEIVFECCNIIDQLIGLEGGDKNVKHGN